MIAKGRESVNSAFRAWTPFKLFPMLTNCWIGLVPKLDAGGCCNVCCLCEFDVVPDPVFALLAFGLLNGFMVGGCKQHSRSSFFGLVSK